MSKKSAQNKTPFQSWYEKNKEEFNRKRREKYHKDPEAREKALENSRRQRQKTQTGESPKPKEPQTRTLGDKKVRVYSISEAAKMIGRSIATIRSWERRKLIPKTVFEGTTRYYTKNQINLLKWMVDEGEKAPSKMLQYHAYMNCSDVLKEKWRN